LASSPLLVFLRLVTLPWMSDFAVDWFCGVATDGPWGRNRNDCGLRLGCAWFRGAEWRAFYIADSLGNADLINFLPLE
jgi:hypothetical protein